MKYELPTFNGSKVMVNVKILKYVVHSQCYEAKTFCMNGKISSQRMYMYNMKALPLTIQKLRQM